MTTPRRWAVWAGLLATSALAACGPQRANPAASATRVSTQPPAATQPAVATHPAAIPLASSTAAPCFTRSQLASMSLAEIASYPTLCFDSESGVTTEVPQSEAIETVRMFLQDPGRLVGFREMTTMGNSPSGILPVARLEDEKGFSYLVAVVAKKVLEMDPAPGPLETGEAPLPPDQLQAVAEDLIRRELPAFDDLRDQLTFQAGNKTGGANFFRWEQPGAATASGMPPLAQVGITDSGHIFSYLNTLYLLP